MGRPSVEGTTPARVRTGVPGLDRLLDGGFPANRAIVLCGGAGTGKTTFGLQFIVQGFEQGEPGAFISVDQKPRHLLEDAAALGLDLKGDADYGALLVLDASPYFTATRGKSWTRTGVDARQVASDLLQQARTVGARRLVVDSMTSLVPPDMNRGQAQEYLRSLIQSLEDNLGSTILLTCRSSRRDPQGTCDALRYLASGVIDLRLRRRGERLVRTLRVRKMRGTGIDLTERPFTIESGFGLRVLNESVEDAARGFQAVSA